MKVKATQTALSLYSAFLEWWKKQFKVICVFLSVLRCPVLSPPANGRLVSGVCSNVYGSICRMQCYKGYVLKESVARTCDKINGTGQVHWTGNAAFCEGK